MSQLSRPRSHKGADNTKDKGANLVEFAMTLPLLLILILGIIEFGFVLAQMNEIGHGAKEGARYAAVSRPDIDGMGGPGEMGDIVAVVCDAVNLPGTTVTVSIAHTESNGTSGAQRLEYGTVTVVADTDPLTGFPLISAMLPDELTNDADFRLEQDAAWSAFSAVTC
jgi:hypothetical protein